MPKFEQAIDMANTDKETALAIAYQAMKNLEWPILFAGEDKLLGSTPKSWKNTGQQILFGVENGQLSISSEMINGESFDMMGKNKKNVAAFIKAFGEAKLSTNDVIIQNNIEAINTLREATVIAAAQEQKQAEEIDRSMNLSGSNLYVTYGIIGINVLVFILMAINGAGIMEPNSYVHINWGSNFTPLTLSGDWWRLVSNIFLHFGIIHLAMNMYCLYTVGVYLEPMLGKVKYTTAYLCTGVLASIASLWWHKEGVNSAGASGAIFGLYGLFLALLTTSLIPKQVRQPLLQSIGIFVAYNLLYGIKSGVDNAAHVGGLVSGFIIGYLYAYGIKKEKLGTTLKWIAPAVIIITVAGAYTYIDQNKVSDTVRATTLSAIKGASYQDNEKFNDRLAEFDKIHNFVDSSVYNGSLTNEQLENKINEIALPQWKKAEEVIAASKAYDISPEFHNKAEKLLQYINLRKSEGETILEIIHSGKQDEGMPTLDSIRTKSNSLFEEIIKLQ